MKTSEGGVRETTLMTSRWLHLAESPCVEDLVLLADRSRHDGALREVAKEVLLLSARTRPREKSSHH